MLRSPYLRPVAFLASGSAIAQILGAVLTPVVTRLYTPSEYGAVAVYGSIVVIIAAVAGGKYESAVILPPDTEQGEVDAISLVRVTILCASLTSAVTMFAVVALMCSSSVESINALGLWALAIPLGVMVTSSSAGLSAYATRRRNYSAIARIAPAQKAVSVGAQIGAGLLKLGISGLMLGAVLGKLAGLSTLLSNYRYGSRQSSNSRWDKRQLLRIARQYSDFPRISTWAALLNAVSWNVQSVVLMHYYSATEVGLYALANGMIGLPTGLVLVGVTQVYQRECAGRAHDTNAALRLAGRTFKVLAATSVPLFVALTLAAKFLFGWLFGAEWVRAGSIALAMMPLLWARFLVTSLTATFNVYRRQRLLLTWQVVALLATLGAFIMGGQLGWSVEVTTWLSSLLVAPLHLILVPLIFRTIRKGRRHQNPQ